MITAASGLGFDSRSWRHSMRLHSREELSFALQAPMLVVPGPQFRFVADFS
jgi:hypothetical protein